MTMEQRQVARAQAADITRTRGTAQAPQPPREIIVQPGPRGIFLSWSLPSGFNADIQGWRIYKDDEATLYAEIKDRGTRQHFIETTAGTTPPVVNVFVSSLNQLGMESAKIQAQGSALAETGAPAMPSSPPGYTQGGAGGGNTGTGYQPGRPQVL
jgi:hypothetical protein